jgi:hypothetical protein
MTIRAVLARPRGDAPDQFEGVYLHNAGMPSELGPTLWNMMRERYRFDAAGFSREMIDANLAGWSNIDVLGGELAKTWDGKTKLSVDQHQENFNNDIEDAGPTSFAGDPQREMPGITAPPIDETSDNWGADVVYVVAQDGLRILVPDGDAYNVVFSAPWTSEPDWDEIDDSVQEAADNAEPHSGGGSDEDDEVFYDEDALETEASMKCVADSYAKVQKGDVEGAQKIISKFLAKNPKSPKVLTNLFFTLQHHNIAAAELTKLFDETIADMAKTPDLITPELVGNMAIVLNNHGRGADSVKIFELAMEHEKWPHAPCYVGMTYGAFASGDTTLMQRAVDHVERALNKKPHVLAQDPSVFDNTAACFVKLGNKQMALNCIKICKDLEYVNFADMPNMPDYASIKDDPEFKALFAD